MIREELKEEEIEILMNEKYSHHSRSEAIHHLKNGATIFEAEDFETNLEKYLEDWDFDEEEKEKFRKMVKEKFPLLDWGISEYNGKTYYIEYVL